MIADTAWSNLIAAAIGAGAVLAANWLGQRRETQRDRRNDAWKLRDAKAARIREDILVIAIAADAFEAVGKQLGVGYRDETREARADRLNEIIAKSTEGLGRAVIRLQLEPGMEGAVDTYKAVSRAFVAFRIGLEMMERSEGRYVPKDMVENLNTLETGAITIIAYAKAKLVELDEPL